MTFKFQPEFMDVEFNFSAMASVVSPSKNSLEVTGHFRSYSDFIALSFNSKDYRMHEGARYNESKDYSGVNLSFSPSFIGKIARFNDQGLRPALTIKYTDGTQKFVTLGFLSNTGNKTDTIKSFTQGVNLSRKWISWDSEEVKWKKRVVVGYENVFDSNGKFVKVREVKELQSGIASREKDYVIDYVSGKIWPVEGSGIPYGAKLTVTYKYGLHQTYNINFSDLKQGTHPNNKVSIPSNNIKSIAFPIIPSYFESGKDQLTGRSDEVVVTFKDWFVSGGNLGDFPKAKKKHLFRVAEGYDDEYYRNPLRLVQAMHHLGYRKVINLYIGASHYYDKKGTKGSPSWDNNAQILIKKNGVCSATKKWIRYLCKAIKDYGFTELILSVSMENLQMPRKWRQKIYDGTDGQTGWKPATYFFSPTNNEVRVYYEKICRDLLDILVEENMPPILQLGEPWWWWQEFKPGNINEPYPRRPPCFYDEATKQKYKSEKGVDLPIFKTSNIELTEKNKEVILWLRDQLGDFSNFVKSIVKSYAGGKYAVLFFPPSILDEIRVPEAIRLVNVPKEQWQFPQLDFIQIEDYDWLIHQNAGHLGIFNFAQKYFNYHPSNTHYFAGFAWDKYIDQTGNSIAIAKQWLFIETAAEIALAKGISNVFIWAGTQIRRDSWSSGKLAIKDIPEEKLVTEAKLILTELGYVGLNINGQRDLAFENALRTFRVNTLGHDPSLIDVYEAPLYIYVLVMRAWNNYVNEEFLNYGVTKREIIKLKKDIKEILSKYPGYEKSVADNLGIYNGEIDKKFKNKVTLFLLWFQEYHMGNYLEHTYKELPENYKLKAFIHWVDMVKKDYPINAFVRNLLPEDYYERIPNVPLYDDALENITNENKYESKTADEYYVKYYYPLDALNEPNYYNDPEQVKRISYQLWARRTYGSSKAEQNQEFVLGMFWGLIVAPAKELIEIPGLLHDIYTGIQGVINDPWKVPQFINFLCKACYPGEEQTALVLMINQAIEEWKKVYDDAEPAEKGRMIGDLIGQVLITAFEAGASAKEIIKFVKSGKFAKTFSSLAEATAKLKKLIKSYNIEDLSTYIKKIIKYDEYYEIVTPDGVIVKIKKSDVDVPEEMIYKLDEIAEGTGNLRRFASRADAEAWAKKVFGNWKKGLNALEVEAITEYSGAAYSNINAVLRGVEPSFVGNNAKYADDLAQALRKSSIPESARLYRGTSKEMLGALKNTPVDELVGKGISDKAFMSTSMIPEGQFGGDLVLKIDAPAGTKGAFIGDLSKFPSEVEVLLQKGQQMIIKEAKEVNGVLELVVEVIN